MRHDSSLDGRHAPRAGDIVLRLGILPPDDSEDLKVTPHILASEYATRYLEQIGVKPSKQTMDLVHKAIPLTSDQIKTTLRSKGHVMDEVTIACPRVEHDVKVQAPISSFSFAQLTLSGDSPSPSSSSSTSLPSIGKNVSAPEREPGSTFRDLASLYLYPFNIKSSGPVDSSHPLVTIRENVQGGEEAKSSFWGGRASPSDAGLIEGVSAEDEVAEELVQELVVTPEVILMTLTPLEAALVEWYKAQSAETVARLPYADFKEGLGLISSDSSIKFFATMINMMHTEFIKGSKMYRHDAESKMMRQSLMRKGTSVRGSMAGSLREASKSGRMGSSMRLGGGGGAQGDNTPPSASSVISRPMALQQYDLGYKIFVQERMLTIAASEDSQRELLERRKMKGKSPAALPVPRVSTLPAERGSSSNDGSLHGSRSTSQAGIATLSLQTRKGMSFNPAQASGSFRGSLKPGQGEAGIVSTPSLRRDAADKEGKQSGGGNNSHHTSTLHVPGLAGEPLLADAHPLVQKSIANLASAHALTAASMARAILESLDAKDLGYLQQVRLFTLQKEFAAMYSDQRKTRVGLFFALPIFLMFLRLSIQSLFSTMYPLWCRTKDGRDSLASMDKVCCQLLDPHSYLEKNLTVLQSSPAAIDLVAKNPSKGHEPERVHFTDTSSLLRSALLSPSSAATRKIMVAQSQKAALKQGAGRAAVETKKIHTQLTFEMRQELFTTAQEETKRKMPRRL